MNMKYAALLAFVSVLLWSCADNTPKTDDTPRSEISVGDTVFLESGVKYVFKEMSEDTTRAVQGSGVTTHINLYVNGNNVWNTYEPLQPFGFVYKRDRMIAGFDEVIQYLRPNDRVTAIIPPELGYGSNGSPTIPANSTLEFDIKVLSIKN